jgi:hypothetical protein
MKTTEITVNSECPGCGKECPPKLGIPNSHQYGWEWDSQSEQRWCDACYTDLLAQRHFKAVGWVWKVTYHDVHGERVKYVDTLTDYIWLNEQWGRVTVTTVYDPDKIFIPPKNAEEFKERIEKMVKDLEANGVTLPIMSLDPNTATALREETGP